MFFLLITDCLLYTSEYTFEQDGFKVFTEEMNYAHARGPHAEWPSISEAIYTATQSVIVDGTSAKDALETAAAKINPIVEELSLIHILWMPGRGFPDYGQDCMCGQRILRKSV